MGSGVTAMTIFLVALDGSESALRALATARAECKKIEASSLHLLTVHPPWVYIGASSIDLERVARLSRTYDEWVMGQARTLLAPDGPRYTHEALEGEAAAVIAEKARAMQCAAIFVGARGMGHSRSARMGSTAARVRELSCVPVRVID
jgi:nucleotide-binding universal stress UspA family protein